MHTFTGIITYTTTQGHTHTQYKALKQALNGLHTHTHTRTQYKALKQALNGLPLSLSW